MTVRLPPWSPWLVAAALAAGAAVASPASAGAAVSLPGVPLDSPIAPVRVERVAAIPEENWHPGHRGVDLAAVVDQPVLSPGHGVVTFAGIVVDRPVVTVTLLGGLRSSVEPVTASVVVGDAVVRGQQVGTVSAVAGHCAPQTCVHWGVRRGDAYLDPLDLLQGWGPVKLLEVS